MLELYGLKSLAIDGSMSYESRDKVVAQFHAPDKPRIFIFSSVGSAGLNLSIADVVIFFVRCLFFFQPPDSFYPSSDSAMERAR